MAKLFSHILCTVKSVNCQKVAEYTFVLFVTPTEKRHFLRHTQTHWSKQATMYREHITWGHEEAQIKGN